MSRTESLEIERKYDVAREVQVPDLAGAGPIDRVEALEPFTLRAVYVDTPDHLLIANRITLRRREGGPDAGWHLKLPAGAGARREVHSPLGADPDEELPAELRRLVEALLRGRPVHPVLVLTTTRTVTRLLDADGTELAELADDEVTAADPAEPDAASTRTWREWEVELAPGIDRADGEAVQDAVSERLEAAGASVSASASKLARGLGDRLPAPVELAPAEVELGSAAEFVYDTVTGLTSRLVALDPAAREGDDDAVHRFRTTVRRIRSVLRVYRGVLSADDEAWFDDALRRLGRAAGVVRDIEVREELLDHYVDAAPAGRVAHEAVGRMRASLQESAREAAADFGRVLDDPAYFELLDRLEALPYGEPAGDRADDDSDEFIADALQHEGRRAHRRVRAATARGAGAGGASHEVVHAARKAARRLRYALEAAKAAGVKGTGDARRSTHALQDLLGDALDAGALADWVVQAADTARWADEDTFGHGVIVTLADADRMAALRSLRKTAKGL